MAEILIRGMEMPREGQILYIDIYPDGKVAHDFDLSCKQIATAVPVPPHGRLIDADDVDTITVICNERGLLKAIDAPIIIPASKVKNYG